MLHPAIFEDTVGAGIVSSLGPAAWFRHNTGITITGLGVSQWDDQSGNARHLLQGTDANRPIGLLHTGTNYLYLPGVAGNYASTPDSVVASITGDIDIRVRVRLDDWTPAASNQLISKYGNENDRSYYLAVTPLGALISEFSGDGTAPVAYTSSSVTGFTDGTTHWVRITRNSTTGAALFYTSDDDTNDQAAVTWTQLGDSVAGAATTLFNGTAPVEVGARADGAYQPSAGKIYRASIYSTIGGTTPVVDFDAALATDQAATFVASTGETWTINSTGSKPAQIVARSSILFDGADHFLKCSAFTLNQPETVFILFKQVSWTAGDSIADGNAAGTGLIYQTAAGASPQIDLNAGSAVATNSNLAIGSYGALAAVFNGASSILQINNTTATTGNAGIGNMGGFTLGARPTPGNYANIQALEAIIFPSALSTANIARVQRYLSRVGQLGF